MVPNHVEKENRCRTAPACADRTDCVGDARPAAAMAPRMATERKAAVLCSRGCVQGVVASCLFMEPLPSVGEDDDVADENRADFGIDPKIVGFGTRMRFGCRLSTALKWLNKQLARRSNGKCIMRLLMYQ